MVDFVPAVKKLRAVSYERVGLTARSQASLHLLQSSFSSRRVSRRFPLLAGLHRVADGALVGVLLVVALTSTFALHWQHLWTVAFNQLESTRDLIHRLTESNAMLERYLLERASLPMSMVPTKTSDLIYIKSPDSDGDSRKSASQQLVFMKSFFEPPSVNGY